MALGLQGLKKIVTMGSYFEPCKDHGIEKIAQFLKK